MGEKWCVGCGKGISSGGYGERCAICASKARYAREAEERKRLAEETGEPVGRYRWFDNWQRAENKRDEAARRHQDEPWLWYGEGAMTVRKQGPKREKTDEHPWYEGWSAKESSAVEAAIRRENGEEMRERVCVRCGERIGGTGKLGLCKRCARQTVVETRLQARRFAQRVRDGERLRLRFGNGPGDWRKLFYELAQCIGHAGEVRE